ncbi:MAG TPA: serine dehydratase beta chain, partial [Negativicutes bacterium]|nr:serine dehydratase beta chain [Negativicutes bacterium]
MESIKNLFRIGHGPSSSHTMGPSLAADQFRARTPNATRYRVSLYGSLAATGKGHLTDAAVKGVFAPVPAEFVWKPDEELPMHPNGMIFEALDEMDTPFERWQGYSIGGGAILGEGEYQSSKTIYSLDNMQDILRKCTQDGKTFWEYVEDNEGPEIWDYLKEILRVMHASIERGLNTEGVLPGGLGLARHAWTIYRKIQMSGGHLKKEG